jgi:acyl-CoA synthetase (AMP-forming)/AMP-acid ligase II
MSETLGSVLARAARQHAGAEAVVDGETRWSYAELDSRVQAFDAALDDLGFERGDVVAVLAQNSAEHVVTSLAIPRSGRVLNDLNYRLAPAELEFILGDSGAKALVVDDGFLELGQRLASTVDGIEHLIERSSLEALCTSGAARPLERLDPDALAGIFYTGGTTGLPKGAMLSHRNLIQNAKHMLIALGYDESDTYIHAAPMFHLADGASLFGITWVGGKHVTQRAFTPAGWLDLVESERATRGMLVPTMIAMVLEEPALAERDVRSLRSVMYGASPMPTALLARAMESIPCDWYQGYGMTEAAPLVSVLTAIDHRAGVEGAAQSADRLRSAGRPIVGVEVEVRRPDGTPCADRESGEIYVRGPNVMQGYWNRPDETAQALAGDGWYRTGDAALMDADGYLYIIDRVKDMIVSGGENVYSTEVENAIYRHEAVLECAVFGIPHPRLGEQVHAAVVTRNGAAVDADELMEHCRSLIAGYKLPRSIEFMDALPKSGAGKILKRDLRAPFWQGHERQVS